MTRSGLKAGLLLVLVGALCACQPAPPAMRQPYVGPTLTLEQVIQRIKQNNQKLPTIWARVEKFQAWFPDAEHKTQYIDGEGNLMFTRPGSLRLLVRNEAIGLLFDLGSNGEQFWLYQKQPEPKFWSDADKDEIPIRPDLVLEVLGIRPIDTFLLQQPVPVMRFSNDDDAYIIVWQRQLPDRWIAEREVWYDRQTLYPELVRLFDVNGRVILQARLSDYLPVECQGVARQDWPEMASLYELYLPDSGTKMILNLDDLGLSHNGYPMAASYRMPDPQKLDPGVRK